VRGGGKVLWGASTHLVFAVASVSVVEYSIILSSPPTLSKPDDAPSFDPTATSEAREVIGLHERAPPLAFAVETSILQYVSLAEANFYL